MIPYGRQNISQDDIDSVIEVLKSDFLTQGPKVPDFEATLAKKVGASYGVAVNSATSALHIACMALDLGPGDFLWTSPITFVASANCALYCGASVDFVDIDPATYNLCAKALEKKLVSAEKNGLLPKVVVAVHLCGQSCDMERIWELSRRFGFKIVEDASHAIGAKYKEHYVGCGRFSDLTVFSFHPVKIVTSGEGGMVMGNDETLLEKLRCLRSHGIVRDKALMKREADGPWYYEQVSLGYNYRITDIQAALGLSQLARLDEFVSRRNDLAVEYNKLLTDLPIRLPYIDPKNYSAFHLYVIRLKTEKIQKSHLEVFNAMREKGISVNLHYIPVHLQPFYKQLNTNFSNLNEAESYYREAITLPLFPDLQPEKQLYISQTLRESLGGFD